MEHRVGLEEAAHKLADLVREAESGGSVVLTRDGAAVARLVPIPQATISKAGDPASDAAFTRLKARMDRGYHLGGGRFVRDEAYDE